MSVRGFARRRTSEATWQVAEDGRGVQVAAGAVALGRADLEEEVGLPPSPGLEQGESDLLLQQAEDGVGRHQGGAVTPGDMVMTLKVRPSAPTKLSATR